MKVLHLKGAQYLGGILTSIKSILADAIKGGPVEIEVKRYSKSREQERKYHAMIGDIAKTVWVDGRQYDREIWKAWLVDLFEFERMEMGEPLMHPGQTVLSLDGRRAVTVRASTAKLRKDEASDFIEFLYMKGTELGARFNEPSMRYYEEAMARAA